MSTNNINYDFIDILFHRNYDVHQFITLETNHNGLKPDISLPIAKASSTDKYTIIKVHAMIYSRFTTMMHWGFDKNAKIHTHRQIKLKISYERHTEQFTALCAAKFTEHQANQLILIKCSNNSVLSVLKNYEILLQPPYTLTREQIVVIAGHIGGSKNIEAVKAAFTELTNFQFSQEQIIRIAGHSGGSKNIEAVRATFTKLKKLHFTPEQIVTIVEH